MRKLHPRPVLMWLLLAALLAGCGQKGPLYLPKSPTQPTTEQTGDDQSKKDRAKTKAPSPSPEQTPEAGL